MTTDENELERLAGSGRYPTSGAILSRAWKNRKNQSVRSVFQSRFEPRTYLTQRRSAKQLAPLFAMDRCNFS
jgi:hypothetical protein